MKATFISALFLFGAFQLWAQNGNIDPSFGTNGFATPDAGSSYDWCNASAIQPDGKVILAGHGDFNTSDLVLYRLNSDGTPDNSFDGDGLAIHDLANSQDAPQAVMVQPDGKILVAGKTVLIGIPGQSEDFFVARFNSDGSIDNTFNGNGFHILDIQYYNNQATDIALQSDGKILLTGFGYNQSMNYMEGEVCRFLADGTMDTTFAGSGVYRNLPVNFGDNIGFDEIVVQPDGKIVAAGRWFDGTSGSNYNLYFVRLNDNGSADPTFDGDGDVSWNLNFNDEELTGMVLQPDGEIIAVGRVDDQGSAKGFAVRLLTDGSHDTSFGTAGLTICSSGTNFDMNYINDVVLHPNGNIYLGGHMTNGAISNNSFIVFALFNNGLPDGSFGTSGYVVHPYQNDYVVAKSMLMQADFKIVVSGFKSPLGIFAGLSDFIALRITSDMTTEIIEDETKNDIPMLPNPVIAGEGFKLSGMDETSMVRIWNTAGSLVFEKQVQPYELIMCQNQAPGFYTIRVQGSKQVMHSVLVIQ